MTGRAVPLTLGLAAILGGCAHEGDPHRAQRLEYVQAMPASFDDPEAGRGALPSLTAPDAVVPGRTAWWQLAGDRVLDEMIDRADGANNDILVAAARLAQARAIRGAAQAARLPRADISAEYLRTDSVRGGAVTAGSQFSTQVDLGWDPDLFGRLRADAKAARFDMAAAGLDLGNVRRIVRTELIRAYVSYRAVQMRLGYVRLSAERQQDILDMVEKRYALGLSVETDRQQARLQLLQVRAIEPQLRNELNMLRNRMAVLLGEPSSALTQTLSGDGAIPAFPAPATLGVPADVVRNRPDVQAAQNRLLAAGERIGSARAALLPQLTIGGSLSTIAPSPAGLFDAIVAQTVGRIAQSLFAGGARKAAVAQNKAIADEALALFRNSVLVALESTENALSTVRTSNERLGITTEALDAAEQAAKQARRQNELGLIDFYIVLAAEQSLLAQRDDLASVAATNAIAVAELHAALGGSALP